MKRSKALREQFWIEEDEPIDSSIVTRADLSKKNINSNNENKTAQIKPILEERKRKELKNERNSTFLLCQVSVFILLLLTLSNI